MFDVVQTPKIPSPALCVASGRAARVPNPESRPPGREVMPCTMHVPGGWAVQHPASSIRGGGGYARIFSMNRASAAATSDIASPTTPPITFDIIAMFMCDSHTDPSESS